MERSAPRFSGEDFDVTSNFWKLLQYTSRGLTSVQCNESLLRKSSKRNSPRNKIKFCFLVRYSLVKTGLFCDFWRQKSEELTFFVFRANFLELGWEIYSLKSPLYSFLRAIEWYKWFYVLETLIFRQIFEWIVLYLRVTDVVVFLLDATLKKIQNVQQTFLAFHRSKEWTPKVSVCPPNFF